MAVLLSIMGALLWVYGIASWCMCFYVFFSSSEGIHWFLAFQNYLLMLGAAGSLAISPFVEEVPLTSIVITYCGWAFYAMLVTVHYWRFKLWSRHIVPVNAPLACLFMWALQRSSQASPVV